jgi:hypothetical protein
MTTDTRPLIPGYLRAHLLMTDYELAYMKDDLERFAEKAGYRLGRVFVERVDSVPAVFGALLELLEQDRPEAVVIPSAVHLAPLGIRAEQLHYLEAATGVRVLVVNSPLATAGGAGVAPAATP